MKAQQNERMKGVEVKVDLLTLKMDEFIRDFKEGCKQWNDSSYHTKIQWWFIGGIFLALIITYFIK